MVEVGSLPSGYQQGLGSPLKYGQDKALLQAHVVVSRVEF